MIWNKNPQGKITASAVDRKTIGPELNFAAAEAYKLLRTNLSFALPESDRCRIVGITSAGSGEGKSTTSLNLAYMLAETDKKVLLLEADMRLPTVAQRLELKSAPGLSNVLAGLSKGEKVLQNSGIQPNLRVIASGDIPPNPSELLGSEKMQMALEVFSKHFDYIVIDLPPVNEVADALVVSKMTDGLIMVVCQNKATRGAVEEAMRQLKYAEAKILGFVMSFANTPKKGGKYYKKGYGYGYGERQAKGDKK